MKTELSDPARECEPAPRLHLGRWVALCSIAEGIGMTAAAASARLAAALPPEPRDQAMLVGLVLVIIGGLVEGVAIGTAQARGLRRLLPSLGRARWVVITTAIAGLGWAAASAPSALSPSGDDSTPPVGLIAVLALGLGGVLGAVLGAAQATSLVAIVRHPWRWIGVSAIAWAPTMTIIFLGATTPDASWPDAAVVALGTLTGAIAGSVLALASWPLLPLLEGSTIANEVVKSILRSPVHGLLDRSLVILQLRGRVSRRLVELPVQFAWEGAALVIVAGRSERKRWWKNLLSPARARVCLNGEWHTATAGALRQGDEGFDQAGAAYRARWPRVQLQPDPVIVVVVPD